MKRGAGLLSAACLSAALAAPALGAEIALLKSSETPSWRPAIEAFKRAASALTVTEFDLRGERAEADGVVASLRGTAAAIVAMGPLAVEAARAGAPELPLVACMVPDLERLGIEPGATVSAVAFEPPVMNQLAAFRAVNPRGIHVGVIYNPESSRRAVEQARRAAPVVRLRIVEKTVAGEKDVAPALRALLAGAVPIDALWLPPDPLLLGDQVRRYLLAETLKAGKPVYASLAALVPEGALVSDGPDLQSVGEQAAELLRRLLSPQPGVRVEFAVPRAELIINRKIAERLKIDISPEVLKLAAKVY